ncbi:MAG: translocase [Microbacteriaceae bacterium]|nr:translocase [Microbacteriaceae bacterium]
MDEKDAASLGRFLTLTDTAEVLNISLGQAYSIVRSGELPAIKVGARGQWRVERSVLESYIEAKYEEARRMSLWNQSDFANIPELAAGRTPRDTGSRGKDQNRTNNS